MHELVNVCTGLMRRMYNQKLSHQDNPQDLSAWPDHKYDSII